MSSKKALKNRLVAKVVDGDSGPCAFCRQTNNDEVAVGKLYSIGELYCHYFCVLLSCCLVQKGQDEQGLLGFLYTDIQAELERSKKHKCSFCGQEGATLGCSVSQCRKQFHMPCGRRKQAVSLFFGNYKSFCSKHAPRQKIDSQILEKMKQRMQGAGKKAAMKAVMGIICDGVPASTDEDDADVCVICYEPVEPGVSAQTFWPPCCARDARFHRHCLERMALSAGIHYLRCPLCNDKDHFYRAVVSQGYYVPDRDAAWELEQNAFADIYDRDVNCNADDCRCPMGRGHDTENGAWDIKLCLLCGSCGVHAACLAPDTCRYICAACLPAAPEDLEGLEAKILQIQEEQARTARVSQASQPRRVMPSRMSLRSTKEGVVSTSRNWRLQAATSEAETEEQSSTAASRSQLNLKTPKRYSRHSRPPVATTTHAVDEDTLVSPLKYLRQRLEAARAHVDAERMAEILRVRFKRPRPLSQKRRIVNAIVDEILREGPKVRSPLKGWTSPKKIDCTPKKNQKASADDQPPHATPKQSVADCEKTPSKEGYIGTPKRTPVKSPKSTKAKDLDGTLENNDESSSSTFQLPSEFVAEHISDDDLPVFDTPKKCTTVEIEKDSSMEISNEEAKINIDLIKIESEEEARLKDVYVKTPERTVKCSYKFSPTDKEVLETVDVGIDVESFKNRYLTEVVKDFQTCAYSHNHEGKDLIGNRIKTPIDFAVEAVKRKFLDVKDNENGGKIMEIATKTDDSMRKGDNNCKRLGTIATKLGVGETTNRDGVSGRKRRIKSHRKENHGREGVTSNKKLKPSHSKGCERKERFQRGTDDGIIVYGSGTGLKRKDMATADIGRGSLKEYVNGSVNSNPKVDVEEELKHTLDEKYTEDGVREMSKHGDDESKRHPNEEFKQKSKSKEERRVSKLNKKQKKNKRYLLKCEKSRSSVKIKLVYNESDATDDNCIDLTVESKKENKTMKHKRSVSNKEINLKIKFKSEQKKRKKSTLSPNALKQTVLNFSPENVSIKNCLMAPKKELTPMKKRINLKKEFPMSTDCLKQTSIQSFFNKIKSHVKDE